MVKGNTKKTSVDKPKKPDQVVDIPAKTLERWKREDAEINQLIASHNMNRQNDIRTLCEIAGVPENADAKVQPDGSAIYVFEKS